MSRRAPQIDFGGVPRSLTARKFWQNVESGPYTECWEWKGATSHGYGILRIMHNYRVRRWAAHRLSWTLNVGIIPFGLYVLHHCDNRLCVNPAHLRTGTNDDNMEDRRKRMRHNNLVKTHCVHGHEFTPENTRWQGEWRACRTCLKRYSKERLVREKEERARKRALASK